MVHNNLQHENERFIEDMRFEFGMSSCDSNQIFSLLSTYSINNSLKEIQNICSKYRVLVRKVAIGSNSGERRMFFSTEIPNKDNCDELFYITYTNSNEVLDMNQYSFLKNWDTSKRKEGYCQLLA